MKKTIIFGMFVLTVLTFGACTKAKDGVPGAQGPAGNANVQNYSITVTPSQWTFDNTYQHWYYRYYTSMNSESAVLGYVMSGSGKQAIPYYQHDPSSFQFDMATYLFGTPPYIEFQYSNFTSLTTKPSYDTYFYIVSMPPAMIVSHPNVDFKNYVEVKKTFNLKD